MHETIQKMARAFAKQREQRRRACAGFTALALLVSISTTYLLVRPANTMAADYYCGYEAHIHTEECYQRVLICGYDTEDNTVSGGGGIEWLPPEFELPEGVVPPAEGEIPVEGELPEVIPPAEGEIPVEGELPEVIPPAEGETPVEGELPEVIPPAEGEIPVEGELPEVTPPAEGEIPVEGELPEVTPPAEEPPVVEVPEVKEPETAETPAEPDVPAVEETPAEEPEEEPEAPAESETLTASSIQYDEAPAESGSSEDSAPADSGSDEPAPAPKEESKPAEAPKTEAPKEEPKAEEPAETPSEEPAAPAEPSEPAEGEIPSEEIPSEGGEEESPGEPPVEGAEPETPAEPEGHVHTEDCYEYVLICELPEHIHTELCLPQSMMQLLPEGAEIPEGYDYEYSYVDSDAGFAVAVYAPYGALPEDAELVAELLEEGSDAHATAAQTLEAMAAQEVAVNVGGVMPESALEEAAENADPDVEYIEEPEIFEEELTQPEEPAAPVEGEIFGEIPADPRVTETEAPAEESAEPEVPAEPPVEEPAEEPAEEPEAEEPAEGETLTASSIQYDEIPAEEPVVEKEIPAEEPVVEEEIPAEEPVVEEEPVEEPIVEETPVEEPVAEEPVVEEPVDETPIEEPVTEDVPVEEEPEEEAEPVPYEGEFRYDGFVALDIHFELDGEEIEPTKPVFVCINVKGLLPETADPDSVAVQHHMEAENEEVPVEETEVSLMDVVEEPAESEAVVEMVADSTAVTGTVEVVESEEFTGKDVATFFAVDSFSTFTVTWEEKGKILNVHCVDTDGKPIGTTTGINIYEFGGNNTHNTNAIGNIDLKLLTYDMVEILNLPTYSYVTSYIYSNGQKVTTPNISFNNSPSQNLPGWIYKDTNNKYQLWLKADGTNLGESDTADAYIVLQDNGPEMVFTSIHDDINVTLYDFGSAVNTSSNAILDFFSSPSKANSAAAATNPYFAQIDGQVAPNAKGEIVHDNGGSQRPILNRTLNEYPEIVAYAEANLDANNNVVVETDARTVGSLSHLFHKNGASQYTNPVSYTFSTDTSVGYKTAFFSNRYTMDGDGGLFQVSGDGYYEYDSNENAAFYNGERFELYNALIAPGFIRGMEVDASTNTLFYSNFFPFNRPVHNKYTGAPIVDNDYLGKPVYFTGYSTTEANPEVTNNWFGMTMDFQFMMPKNGKLDNGNDMIFEFHGDDDVWVFIDNVLVLDIGGTHGAQGGSINFATGDVKFPKSSANKVTEETTLRELYKLAYMEANKLSSVADDDAGLLAYLKSKGFDNETGKFANYSNHSLNFYYMERGGNISYCKLRFNMPILPKNSLSIEKKLEDGDMFDNSTYSFQVLDKNGAVTFMETDYDVYVGDKKTETRTTDANGIVSIAANERAVFGGITVDQGNFSVRELIPIDEVELYDDVTVNGGEPIVGTDLIIGDGLNATHKAFTSPALDIDGGIALYFEFTNDVKVGNLLIDKSVYVAGAENNSGVFTFDLTVVDDSGATVDLDATYPTTIDGTNVTFVDGEAQISVTAGTSITITGLLTGTKIRVTETNYDGYAPSWSFTENGTYNHSATADAVTIPAGDTATVYFRNTTGPVLPHTGGTGTHIYTTLGVVMMLGAGVLLLNQRRRKEADSVT